MADAILRGKVTRVQTGRVYASVPRLGGGLEYGPLVYVRHRVGGGWSDPPEVGDTVVLGVVENCPDELIVIGVQS